MGLHDVGCSDRPALPHRCCSPLGGVRHVQTLGMYCYTTIDRGGTVITSHQITCITARHILKISSYSTHTKQWARFVGTQLPVGSSHLQRGWCCRSGTNSCCSARLEVFICQIVDHLDFINALCTYFEFYFKGIICDLPRLDAELFKQGKKKIKGMVL